MRNPSAHAPALPAANRVQSGVPKFFSDLSRVVNRDQQLHGPFPGLAPEDVVHEAILSCLDPERLGMKTCRSVRAKAAKRRQRGGPNEMQLGDQAIADRNPEPSMQVARDDLNLVIKEQVRLAVESGRLSATQQEVIEFRFHDGLTFDEISKRLALPNRQAAFRLYERGMSVLALVLQPLWRDVFGESRS
jgi:hypothetical protein